jgi:hypothetical protein
MSQGLSLRRVRGHVSCLAPDMSQGQSLRRVLKALRVDVDDDAEAGAPHRRRGRAQQPPGLRG